MRELPVPSLRAGVDDLRCRAPAGATRGAASAVLIVLGAWGSVLFAADQRAAPVEERLTTRDGVQLAVTYLPGGKGKDTVPVVLLHAYKGDRRDFQRLAGHLQSLGHAVLVPDLRGHGDSTRMTNGTALNPGTVNFQAMAVCDMETIARWLVEKNNKQELNLDALCVVGAEMGAAVAIAWAAIDWSQPAGSAWGQDVKALVLLSPKLAFRNLKLSDALRFAPVARDLSILIVAGRQNSRALAEASRLHGILAAGRPEPTRTEDRSLLFSKLDTALQSTDLLAAEKLLVPALIAEFIDHRLVRQPYPWKARPATK